ncbi:DUF2834 domain-containing protein [Raphidiopsis sp. BLCC-F218]
MLRRIILLAIWLGFVSYAFFLAPPDNFPLTVELIKNLCVGNWQGINPLIIALFYLMGIWPLVYSAILFFDGRGQKIVAWPFAFASFGVGAFAILPYLVLRAENPEFTGGKNWFLKNFDSRWTGISLSLAALVLVGYGWRGDGFDFVHQWQTNRFIHVMTLDFLLLSLLFPILLGDDMTRRGWHNHRLWWLFALIPLFGPLVYLCVRPPIKESTSQ